jgi:hypothetical protein
MVVGVVATVAPAISVSYRLVEDGLVFGGDVLTATDITVASGAADIGDAARVASLDRKLVETAVRKMHAIIDNGIDQMKSSRDAVPVILVGGGAVLVSRDLKTASDVFRPEHSGVANAIGAANAQVGSETERIVSYRRTARDQVISEMSDELTAKLLGAGAAAATIRLADVEETSISYMADDATRIRVKMVGDLEINAAGAS